MPTSNNTIWQLSRDDIINAALRKISVLGEGQVANAQQLLDGAQALNALVSELQPLGLELWKRAELDITLVAAQTSYTIGIGQAIAVPFPTKILQVMSQMGTTTTSRVDMQIKSRNEFNNLPINSTGTPVAVTYHPFINYGVLTVWPTPTGLPVGSKLVMTYQKPFDIFTSGTETIDFPQEWHNTLIYHLAALLADEYQLPLEDRRWLETRADKRLATVLSGGSEGTSLLFYPNGN